MKTKADLRKMMLTHLTVIDPTENPDAEQALTADLWIDTARAFLSELGLVWWDEDAIPDAVALPLSRYCASLSPSSFGRAGKGFETYEAPSRQMLATLKSSPQRETIRSEYM